MENVYQTQNKRLLLLMLAAAALLTVPLVAMRFTGEVKWGVFDFIVAGVLLFGTAITIEVALRMITSFWMRIAACGAILFALFLVWAELAVGIFGSPIAGS
jgi:hypothetical protein